MTAFEDLAAAENIQAKPGTGQGDGETANIAEIADTVGAR